MVYGHACYIPGIQYIHKSMTTPLYLFPALSGQGFRDFVPLWCSLWPLGLPLQVLLALINDNID